MIAPERRTGEHTPQYGFANEADQCCNVVGKHGGRVRESVGATRGLDEDELRHLLEIWLGQEGRATQRSVGEARETTPRETFADNFSRASAAADCADGVGVSGRRRKKLCRHGVPITDIALRFARGYCVFRIESREPGTADVPRKSTLSLSSATEGRGGT